MSDKMTVFNLYRMFLDGDSREQHEHLGTFSSEALAQNYVHTIEPEREMMRGGRRTDWTFEQGNIPIEGGVYVCEEVFLNEPLGVASAVYS